MNDGHSFSRRAKPPVGEWPARGWKSLQAGAHQARRRGYAHPRVHRQIQNGESAFFVPEAKSKSVLFTTDVFKAVKLDLD